MAMPADSMSQLLTAEQLSGVALPGKATELVRGHLVVREPPGTRHGSIAARLSYLLADLVAEIVSPDDRPGELLAKVAQWLGAGTRLVWVIDPGRGEARVYRDDGELAIIGPEGLVAGESVLPGFTCVLAAVLR